MKTILKLKSYLILFALTITIASCDLNDDNDRNGRITTSIVDVIKENPNLTTLVLLLEAESDELNIIPILSSPGQYTLLAPTNAAFETFLAGRALSEVPKNDLHQLLLNHILTIDVNEATFKDANRQQLFYAKTAAYVLVDNQKSFINIYFNTAGNQLAFNGGTNNGGATATEPDIAADNGFIHITDRVVELPTIVDFVQVDPRFSFLLGALTSSGQPDFVTILSTPVLTSPAPFTVFAPINSAFTALTAVPTGEDLTKVLQHHVIGGANILTNKISNGLESPATLEGDKLQFSVRNNVGFIEDGSGNSDAKIIILDVQAKNGIVHAIDKVLIPDTTN